MWAWRAATASSCSSTRSQRTVNRRGAGAVTCVNVSRACRRVDSRRMKLVDDQLTLSPTDLSHFLACEHLISLEVAGTPRPENLDPQVELIRRKGVEHEEAYLASLRTAGRDVRTIELEDGDWDAAVAATEQAVRDGVEVVYQAALRDGRWRGLADFLERQPDGTYEAVDTKLARRAKPSYILQLCFYSEQLARIQGRAPERNHVVLGSGDRVSFRPEEFGAYYRRVRDRLERFVADPPETEPWPNEHCSVCDFKARCDEHWDAVDHLSRVAGMRRSQIEKLLAADIATLAALGRAAPELPPAGFSSELWAKVRQQAE